MKKFYQKQKISYNIKLLDYNMLNGYTMPLSEAFLSNRRRLFFL